MKKRKNQNDTTFIDSSSDSDFFNTQNSSEDSDFVSINFKTPVKVPSNLNKQTSRTRKKDSAPFEVIDSSSSLDSSYEYLSSSSSDVTPSPKRPKLQSTNTYKNKNSDTNSTLNQNRNQTKTTTNRAKTTTNQTKTSANRTKTTTNSKKTTPNRTKTITNSKRTTTNSKKTTTNSKRTTINKKKTGNTTRIMNSSDSSDFQEVLSESDSDETILNSYSEDELSEIEEDSSLSDIENDQDNYSNIKDDLIKRVKKRTKRNNLQIHNNKTAFPLDEKMKKIVTQRLHNKGSVRVILASLPGVDFDDPIFSQFFVTN